MVLNEKKKNNYLSFLQDDKKSSRSSLNGRVEKRTDPKQSKVSLKKKLNHLLRKRKDGLAESQDPSTSSTESEEQPEDVDDANQSVEEGEDGGALSLADLESDATSPFVTRHAGSTPKVACCLNFQAARLIAE